MHTMLRYCVTERIYSEKGFVEWIKYMYLVEKISCVKKFSVNSNKTNIPFSWIKEIIFFTVIWSPNFYCIRILVKLLIFFFSHSWLFLLNYKLCYFDSINFSDVSAVGCSDVNAPNGSYVVNETNNAKTFLCKMGTVFPDTKTRTKLIKCRNGIWNEDIKRISGQNCVGELLKFYIITVYTRHF